MDKASSNRDKYVDKFCFCLDRDITELAKEVKEVKNQAQVHVYTCRCSGEWAWNNAGPNVIRTKSG